MLIVGMTACGKTHYLLKMLEEGFKGYFDYVFIGCPIFAENKTYQSWKYLEDPDVFAMPCDHDEVDSYLETIVKIAKGEKQSHNPRRLRLVAGGEKQDQRAGQTGLARKAHWAEKKILETLKNERYARLEILTDGTFSNSCFKNLLYTSSLFIA